MKSDDPDDSAGTAADVRDRPVAAAVPSGSDIPALDRAFDEPQGVRDGPGERYPGKSGSQPGSIAVHEREDLFSVCRSERLQPEIVIDFEGYDGGDDAHRADYTLGPDGDLESLSGL